MPQAINRQDDPSWCVFAPLGSHPPHPRCLVAPTNTVTADQHHVFGPASKAECEAYAARNCLSRSG